MAAAKPASAAATQPGPAVAGKEEPAPPPAAKPAPAAKQPSSYRFTATSLVDYFMMGEGGKLRDKFADLISAVAEGEATETALAKVYPSLPLPVLQEKVRDHRRASEISLRGVCPLPFPVPLEQFADSAKARIEPAPEEDVERLFMGLRMLPRRDGHVDWYPPDMIGVSGGQFGAPVGAP